MNRFLTAVTGLMLFIGLGFLVVGPSSAGPEKIEFPANWEKYVLYTIVDRYDVKQYRELYASTQEAVDAMKQGRPLPDRTVLVLIQYKAQADPQGNPLKDANGRFLKGDRSGFTVMEKRQGWGTEYPDDVRNGEWEYSAFSTDGRFNANANYRGCFQFRLRVRAEQGHRGAGPGRDVGQQRRLAAPDHAHGQPGAGPVLTK